jgi:hypothetical protein
MILDIYYLNLLKRRTKGYKLIRLITSSQLTNQQNSIISIFFKTPGIFSLGCQHLGVSPWIFKVIQKLVHQAGLPSSFSSRLGVRLYTIKRVNDVQMKRHVLIDILLMGTTYTYFFNFFHDMI